MSDQNNNRRDGYYDLLDSYAGVTSGRTSSTGNSGRPSSGTATPAGRQTIPRTPQTRPTGNRPAAPVQPSHATNTNKPAVPPSGGTKKSDSANSKKTKAPLSKKAAKKKKRREQRMKNAAQSFIVILVVILVVILSSMLLKTPILGCVSDIVGFNRSSNAQRVMIDDGLKVDEIIDLLKSKDLIYSAKFCKFATDFLKYDKQKEYPEGIYDLSPDMGIETMLNIVMAAGEKKNTVTITFPEGLTVDQIVDKLVENDVCAADKLYEAMKNSDLFTTYSFLEDINDTASLRARVLEGYLRPDTYEFYIGEDPKSVLTKFLDNFNAKWEDEYTEKANSLGLSTDQIVTVASIIEKEASDYKQMRLVASILYNRRNSPYFSYINCDSTVFYVDSFKEKVDAAALDAIAQQYDTYKKTGFPVGAICNPGQNAIEAALDPENSDYYYFIHDKNGNMYAARTEAEHQANMQYLE